MFCFKKTSLFCIYPTKSKGKKENWPLKIQVVINVTAWATYLLIINNLFNKSISLQNAKRKLFYELSAVLLMYSLT